MRALKALVIFLGILIVAGATVVAVTLYKRLTAADGAREAAEQPATAGSAAPRRSFGVRDVEIPGGGTVTDMVADGERLILYVRDEGGGQRIVIVDMATGGVVGELALEPGE